MPHPSAKRPGTGSGGLLDWARRRSLWPFFFGDGCCGVGSPRGFWPSGELGKIRSTPEQADLLIVSGRISLKMIPVLRRVHAQMAEPKWVMAVGACACSGGLFDTYALVLGTDCCIPVDVYVPGCPPDRDDLLAGLELLQKRIKEGR